MTSKKGETRLRHEETWNSWKNSEREWNGGSWTKVGWWGGGSRSGTVSYPSKTNIFDSSGMLWTTLRLTPSEFGSQTGEKTSLTTSELTWRWTSWSKKNNFLFLYKIMNHPTSGQSFLTSVLAAIVSNTKGRVWSETLSWPPEKRSKKVRQRWSKRARRQRWPKRLQKALLRKWAKRW